MERWKQSLLRTGAAIREAQRRFGIPEEIEKFSQSFVQRDARKLHRVLIIGAGRAGRALAAAGSAFFFDRTFFRSASVSTVTRRLEASDITSLTISET